MMGSRFLQLLLVGVICISGYVLLQNQEQSDVQVVPDTELPLFTGRAVRNTTYDQDGRRNYLITSDKLEHYAEGGDTIFDNIELYVYREGTIQEWRVVSELGVLDKHQVLTLSGNVTATNLLPEASFETLATERMVIELKTKDFNTDVEVTLKGPDFVNTAQAMEGNLDSNEATLFNRVQGIYEKTKP